MSDRELGPLGRLGVRMAQRPQAVFAAWAVLLVGFGIFLPKVEQSLAGFGWSKTGSESVEARDLIGDHFGGRDASALPVVVHSERHTVEDPPFRRSIAEVERILREHPDVFASVTPPRPGSSISRDRRTAVVLGGAARDPNGMVEAAGELKEELVAAGGDGVRVDPTGLPMMWSDFNENSKSSMFFAEAVSWPITLAILVLAFGSLVAAGLPLPLTILGLALSGGALYLGTLVIDISLWAMNFALMFSLALGIDYALFVVYRFRQALAEGAESPVAAIGETMDTAGKAVLFSGLTVMLSLLGVLFVPSLAFRTMSIGIVLSVIFVLAAALTLLPALLAKIGHRIDKGEVPKLGAGSFRSDRAAAWAERLARRPVVFGLVGLALLGAAAVPLLHVKTKSPSIETVLPGEPSREGRQQLQEAFGAGAPARLQAVAPREQREEVVAAVERAPGIVRHRPPQTSDSLVLVEATPAVGPSDERIDDIITGVRGELPEGARLGGAVVEAYDLEEVADARIAVVMPVVAGLGFLLVAVAFRSIVMAAVAVISNLFATGAAFGIGTLVFQDGFLAGLFAVDPQGFLDLWVPVFFFAMIFGLAMDYTVFLLAASREQWDKTGDPHTALVEGMARSARVIFSAAAVMIAVFFTFAIASSALPPIEMGVILGVAVIIEATIVRLLLMPVALRLAGRWAWWMPPWLDRRLPRLRWAH